MSYLKKLYNNRFSTNERDLRQQIWNDLYSGFFHKYCNNADTVLDLAAGFGEFIIACKSKNKIAVDLNPETSDILEPKGIRVVMESAEKLDSIDDNSVDVCFVSNFFEHLPSKDILDNVLVEIYRILKSNGKLLILQPNYRFSYDLYFDCYDHYIPLSDRSLSEALLLSNFIIKECYPKFLPFTTKSNYPKNSVFIKIYLKFPFLWNIFGKQLFIVATK